MIEAICTDCGKTYESFGQSHYCPDCRKRRNSERAKRTGLCKIGNKAYSDQQKMRKAQDKTEYCGNCQHYGKDSQFCRNTDSRCWGSRVVFSGWCSRWGKAVTEDG